MFTFAAKLQNAPRGQDIKQKVSGATLTRTHPIKHGS
jgi:hypothetical protein